MTMKDTIIYEHPLNEVIRVCLRLEQLFDQIDHQLNDVSLLGTRNIINNIIQILQVLDRPDLKAKLAKELSHLLANLMRYGGQPDIDAVKLQSLTQQLNDLSRTFIETSGKIGNRLRDVELLNTLRSHLASPGGGCSFDTPVYHYWLQQPVETRQQVINDWLKDFAQIKKAFALVLDLVRKHSKTEQKTAVHGFHQELLDPNANLRMIRICIPREVAAYPEPSIGRHFLSVRFYSHEIENRPVQYASNLPFWVSYCNL
ncbi:MAG: cell division protein ZapD [Gammaproteobacteria bacterium]|nr:cell division protein ZapD [Gammaproteobacteria bacterium]